nr:hypothetical protein [Tanacetum cinerariifolium]
MTPSSSPSYTFLDPTPSPLLNSLAAASIPHSSQHHTEQSHEQPNNTPTHHGPTHTEPPTSPQPNLPSLTAQPHNHGPPSPAQLQSPLPAHQNSPLPPLNFDPPNPNSNTNPVNESPRTHPMITWSQLGIVKSIDRLSLNTFSISPILKNPPAGVNMVRSMWLFKHKFYADGTLSRYKARLVANGGSQQLGVDFDETFSLVVKPTTIRTRSLYGLKQAPHAWFQGFAGYATRAGFYHSRSSSPDFLQHIIASLHNEFGMTDLGVLNYFLGIFVDLTSTGLFLSQKKYALQLLERAHMVNCNHSRTPVDTESKLGPKGVPVQDPTFRTAITTYLESDIAWLDDDTGNALLRSLSSFQEPSLSVGPWVPQMPALVAGRYFEKPEGHRSKMLHQQIGAIRGTQIPNYQELRMTGPTSESVTPLNCVTRNSNNSDHSPSLQDQILNHISSLETLIKEHNEKAGTLITPIRLTFGNEDEQDDTRKDKGKGPAEEVDEDLKKPYKEVLKSPITRRIIEFSALTHQMPTKLKIYDGTDPDDHITQVMQISAFMSNSKCRELARQFADQVPQTVTEMMKRVDDFVKSKEAYKSTKLPKGEHPKRGQGTPRFESLRQKVNQLGLEALTKRSKEILATELQLQLPLCPPMIGTPKKENLDRYCNYHGEKCHYTNDCYQLKRQLEAALESGKLNHLVKDVRQRGNNRRRQARNNITNDKVINMVYVKAEGRSSTRNVEHCFSKLPMAVQARLTQTHTKLVGFFREQLLLMGKIELEVMFGSEGLCRRTMMKFTVVQASSPYNIILRRTGMRELRAISSTMHAMMKFPTPRGITMLVPRTAAICECRQLKEKQILPEEQPKERTTKRDENAVEEEVMINPTFLDQKVIIETQFSLACRRQLINLLRDNQDVFAWQPSDMAGVPRRIIQHSLNVNTSITSVAQKRRILGLEKSKAVMKEVEEWIKAGTVRPLQYPTWISNPVLVKKADGTWRMCMDFKNIQMSEEDEEKTTFYTDQGTYCYVKMPFGLKNAGATYQRLVDSAFQAQLGRNLEAYVDDMVIKSKTEREIIMDIAETFDNLRKVNMKLNPKKCSSVSRKEKQAFQEMKKLILELPTLTTPGLKGTLYIYLAVSKEAVSRVLIADRGGGNKRPFGALVERFTRLKETTTPGEIGTMPIASILKTTKNAIKGQILTDFLNEVSVGHHAERGNGEILGKGEGAVSLFKKNAIENMPRSQNQKADVLSKLALVAFNHLTKDVLVEVMNEKSMDVKEVSMIVKEEEDNWMTPIIRCVKEGIWPKDENEGRTLRMKIGELHNKGVHEGTCGMHPEARSIVAKIVRHGYYWPFMHWDTKDAGLDILGPLREGPGKLKFIIMAIDYFTKWMEAKPLAKTTSKEVKKFDWENIICRFGLPRIKQMNMVVTHPQANGLVERANKSLMHGLKERLGRERIGWVDELPNILWAHQTMLKTSNGETPFSLTYGSEVVISAEIGMPTYRIIQFNETKNEKEMRMNLDLIQERSETAAIREAKYKKKVKQYYNKWVWPVSFKVGDFVYRRDEASRVKNQGKPGPN